MRFNSGKIFGLFAVACAVVGLSTTASAAVDMKNANYTESWIDIQVPGSGYALKVQRTYNSRSVFNGIFGFGWCSDFETTLDKTPEGTLKLQECGAGQEVTYRAASGGTTVAKTIESIIAYYKKTNPNSGESSIETLKEQLLNNVDLRNRWAKQAGLKEVEVAKGSTFVSDNLEVEKIQFDGAQYTRTLVDGSSQRFNTSGRLTAIFDKNGNFLKFTYAGDVLKEAIDNSGKKLTFSFFPTKRVKEISGPGGIKVEYKYKGEDLQTVKNMWKNTYTFEYDDVHNLTKVTFPDDSFKALTYNQKNDWVTSFTDRALNGQPACKESYEYNTDKSNPKDHFWSNAVKKCGNEVKNEARFEFWLKTRADGRKVLARVLNRSMTDTLDISYHPEYGRPTSIKKNSQTTSYDYYASGLVKEKTTSNTRMVFEYKNTFNKVSKVNTEYFDLKGKVAKKRETTFAYDSRGNLSDAKNSDGQSVRLTYDQKGRIASITDHAKKEVQIKYEEKTGRPAQITRPKVGTIAVTYKPNGEINKVESNDGAAVATQVASTFNNLLDIIAPATSEMNM